MRVGFVAGIWDLMHEGHLILLRKIKSEVDYLIVIVHDDASCFEIKDKTPVQDLDHRVKNLQISKIPDKIIVTYKKDPAGEFLWVVQNYENAEYFRGNDLTGDFPGRYVLDEHGVKINFLPYTKGISSTQLRKRLWS